MMWMPAWTIRIVWPGRSSPSSGSTHVGHVPGEVVRADRAAARARPASATPSRGHAARRLVGGPVGPQRARAEPDQHHVARAQLDPLGRALAAPS